MKNKLFIFFILIIILFVFLYINIKNTDINGILTHNNIKIINSKNLSIGKKIKLYSKENNLNYNFYIKNLEIKNNKDFYFSAETKNKINTLLIIYHNGLGSGSINIQTGIINDKYFMYDYFIDETGNEQLKEIDVNKLIDH